MIFIKQYGLKRSGTNAARWILEENFSGVRVIADVLGWKHGAPRLTPSWNPRDWYPEHSTPRADPLTPGLLIALRTAVEAGDIRYHLLVKDPRAWLVSAARWRSGNVDLTSEPSVRRALDLWMRRGREFIAFHAEAEAAGTPCVLTRCEDLMADLPRIAAVLRLKRSAPTWRKPTMTFKPTGDLREGVAMMEGRLYDEGYYAERRYLSRIPVPTERWIRDALDEDLVRSLGYEAEATSR